MRVGAPESRALYYPETLEIMAEDAEENIKEEPEARAGDDGSPYPELAQS